MADATITSPEKDIPEKQQGVRPIRKRYRALQSCAPCRTRKLKCDRQRPCQKCRAAHRDCIFRPANFTDGDRVQESGLISSNLKVAPISIPQGSKTSTPISSDINLDPNEPSNGPETTFYTDATHDDFDDDFQVEHGAQLGRIRISQRMGGYYQPDLANRIAIPLKAVLRRKFPAESEESLWFKISSPSLLISRSCRLGQDFASPSSGALFDASSIHFQLGMDLLNRTICESILTYYWGTFHMLFKCVHRPSFERCWDLFWAHLTQDSPPSPSLEALIMGVLLSGCIAMPDMGVATSIGIPKSSLIHRFRAAAEAALVRAKFVRTSKLETLQALIIYLLATCRDELSKEYFTVLSIAINIAESIGLYRDPALFRFGPVDVHVRRLLWHQLCFLDMRACDARRPRPHIREDDFDTPIPPSADDHDLEQISEKSESIWTDTTFSIMRFEISSFHRFVWLVRGKLDRKEVELSDTLETIINFRQKMRTKYSFLNHDIPIQRFTFLVMDLLAVRKLSPCIGICLMLKQNRFIIMLLHRYHVIGRSKLPEQLRNLLIDRSIFVLLDVITLETSSELLPWAWALRAWMPSQVAFLLLMEVSVNPNMPRADEIWRIMDYMFLQPPGLSRDDKSIAVLKEARDKIVQLSIRKRITVPNRPNNLQASAEDVAPRQTSVPLTVPTQYENITYSPETVDPIYFEDSIASATFSEDHYHLLHPSIEDLDVSSHFDWAQWTESFPVE